MWLRVGCLGFLIAMAVPCHAETDAVDAWKKQIVTRLNASKRFPPEAMGQSGTAKVAFVLDRSGKLISKELAESSGFPALDSAALAMVDRAQPFPVPPSEMEDGRLRLVLPVIFGGRSPSQVPTIDISKEEALVNAKMRAICRGC
jgi:protein TonB